MEANGSVLAVTVLVLGDVVDTLRFIVDSGASIHEFEYAAQPRTRATRVTALSERALSVLRSMLADGRAVDPPDASPGPRGSAPPGAPGQRLD